MEWSRIKTALLVLFVLVDVFLIVNINLKRGEKYNLPDEVRADLVSILKEKEITLPDEVLPKKRTACQDFLLSMDADELLKMGKKLLGEDCTLAQNQNTYTLHAQSGTLSLTTDNHFVFTGNLAGMSPQKFMDVLCPSGIRIQTAQDGAFAYYLEDRRIIGAQAAVTTENGAVTGAEGVLPFAKTHLYEQAYLSDPLSALITFAAERGAGPSVIVRMEPVFLMGGDTSAHLIRMGYEIEDDSGFVLRVLAKDGSKTGS